MKISKSEIFIILLGVAASIWTGAFLDAGVWGIRWFVGDFTCMFIDRSGCSGNLIGVGSIVGPIIVLRAFAPLIFFFIILRILLKKVKRFFIPVRTIILFCLLVTVLSWTVTRIYSNWLNKNPEKRIALERERIDKLLYKRDQQIVNQFKKKDMVKVKVVTTMRFTLRPKQDPETRHLKRLEFAKEYVIDPIGQNDLRILNMKGWGYDEVEFDAEVTKKGYEELKESVYVCLVQLASIPLQNVGYVQCSKNTERDKLEKEYTIPRNPKKIAPEQQK